MRISDWSSDVCASDLVGGAAGRTRGADHVDCTGIALHAWLDAYADPAFAISGNTPGLQALGHLGRPFVRDRKSVVKGKSVSVRVDLGGRRIIKKQISETYKPCYSKRRQQT